MFAVLIKTLVAFPAIAVVLGLCVLAGCRGAGDGGQDGLEPTMDGGDAEVMRVVDTGGIPLSHIFPPARDVQDLVNRSHAVVIGTISAVSEPRIEIPYDITEEEFAERFADLEEELRPTIEVVYFDIAIEEVLLDDGNVRAHHRLGMEPDPPLLRVGGRYLFALGRNPDSLSYGIGDFSWMVLTMDDAGVRNLDGSAPGYAGVSDEASLVAAVREAVDNYDFLPPGQWPAWSDSK